MTTTPGTGAAARLTRDGHGHLYVLTPHTPGAPPMRYWVADSRTDGDLRALADYHRAHATAIDELLTARAAAQFTGHDLAGTEPCS